MSENKYKLTIIVTSPDSDRDLFDKFLECFDTNWADCPYPLVLTNNFLPCDNYRVTVVNLNRDDKTWTRLTKNAVDTVFSDYYLLLDCDRFISNTVHTPDIEKVLDIMKVNNIDYFDINRSADLKAPLFHGIPNAYMISKRKPYGLNVNGIFERKYLLQMLGNGTKTAWDIERGYLKESLSATNNDFFDNALADNRNLLNIVHMVLKGKYLPSAIRKMEKAGYHVAPGCRSIISNPQEFKLILYDHIGKKLTPATRKRIKSVLSKIGFKFTTEY